MAEIGLVPEEGGPRWRMAHGAGQSSLVVAFLMRHETLGFAGHSPTQSTRGIGRSLRRVAEMECHDDVDSM